MCIKHNTPILILQNMQSEELHKSISFVLNNFPRSNMISQKLEKSREKLFLSQIVQSVEVRISNRLVQYRRRVQFVFGNVKGIIAIVT